MAFPTIGLGGVLSFDHRRAVTNMGLASRAFHRLRGTAARVRGGMGRLGMAFQRLQVAGVVLGGVGIAGITAGLRNMGRQLVEIENIETAVASNLRIIRDIPVDEAVRQAKEAMDDLRVLAIETPGEVQDVANMWNIVLEPMTRAGFEVDKVNQLTKDATIAAGAMGIPFRDMAESSLKIMSGQLDRQSQVVIKLAGTAKKLGIEWSTQAFQAMTIQERIEALNKIYGQFGAMSEQVGGTWSALFSTVRSMAAFLFRALATPVIEKFRKALIDTLGQLNKAFGSAEGAAEQMGERFVPFFEGLIEGFKIFAGWMSRAFSIAKDVFKRVQEAMQRIGIDINLRKLGQISGIIAAIGVILGAVASVVAPIVLGIGAIAITVSSIAGALSEIWIVFVAIGGVIAAIGGTLATLWTTSAAQGQTFGEFMLGLWGRIKTAFVNFFTAVKETATTVFEALAETWNKMAPGVMAVVKPVIAILTDAFSAAVPVVKSYFAWLRTFWERLAPLLPRIGEFIGKILSVVGKVLTVMRPVFSAIFNVVGGIISGVFKIYSNVVSFIFPALEVAIAFFTDLFDLSFALGKKVGEVGKRFIDWLKPAFEWVGEKLTPAFQKLGMVIRKAGEWIKTTWLTGIKLIASTIAKLLEGASALATELGLGTDFGRTIAALKAVGVAKAPPTPAVGAPTAAAAGAAITATMAGTLAAVMAKTKAKEAVAPIKCPDINLKNTANLNVDGSAMSAATAKYNTEISERSGYGTTPWQQRNAIVKAITPA